MSALAKSGLRTEEQIILALSHPGPSGALVGKAEELLNEASRDIDAALLLTLAGANGVAPLLFRNLKDIPGVPVGLMKPLERAYFRTFGNNIRHAGEMMRIVRLLDDDGVEAMPLKGSLASDLIFGDPGLYPASDIDILVRPSDLEKAEKILVGNGYARTGNLGMEALSRATYHVTLCNEAYTVEVHWNLAMRYFSIPPLFWWEDSIKTAYEGTEITLPSPEKYLLYAMFRLFAHGFRPLKFLVFVAALIDRHRIDWEKLLSYAERYRMRRLTVFSLKLLHDLWGTGIPSSLVTKSTAGYDLTRRLVLSGFFMKATRIHARMLLYTSLLDGPLDCLRVLARRIFPDPAEIRIRYGLSERSNKVFLFYILNPFLLAWKKRRHVPPPRPPQIEF